MTLWLLLHHLPDPWLCLRLVNEDGTIECGMMAEFREKQDNEVRAELRIVD
jgi:hypothetical protein